MGLLAMTVLILLMTLVKGLVIRYVHSRHTEKLEKQSAEKWNTIQIRLDSLAIIQKNQKDSVNRSKKEYNHSPKKPFIKKEPPQENIRIKINSSNVGDFKRLRGIGDKLSQRIVTYRDKLGGFHSKDQIREVYGISDSLFLSIEKSLILDKTELRLIHLNAADTSILSQHPYVSKTLAKQIVGYRTKVKSFEEVEEIKKMYAMTDSIYNKLYPYLTIY